MAIPKFLFFHPYFCYFWLSPIMKRKEKGIIRPSPIRGFDQPLVIHVPFLPPECNFLAHLEPKSLSTKYLEGYSLYLLPHCVLLYGAIGSPLAVMAYERLIASGCQEIILLGLAGSLSPAFRIGQALLVQKAIAYEGTSSHYFPGQRVFSPSPDLASRIETKLRQQGLSFKKGIIITTDAPYRETRSWILEAKKQGAAAVDMETSALLAVASFYGLRASALILISDELFNFRWRPGFSNPKFIRKCRQYFFPFIFNP